MSHLLTRTWYLIPSHWVEILGCFGLSDPEARVGRSGRGFDLGYKLHASVEHSRQRARAGE